jgi:hypothetical protein
LRIGFHESERGKGVWRFSGEGREREGERGRCLMHQFSEIVWERRKDSTNWKRRSGLWVLPCWKVFFGELLLIF